MPFGDYDGGVRNLVARARTGGRGPFASRNVAKWQDSVGTVTAGDLWDLGIGMQGGGKFGSPDAVDPQAMAFEALKAAARGDTDRAERLEAQSKLASASVDEVLRRRQGGFNEMARNIRAGDMRDLEGNTYDGYHSNAITAGTGAALASHARAGRPAEMPEARRAMSLGEHARMNPWSFQVESTRSPMQFTARDYPDVGFGAGDEGAAFSGLRAAAAPMEPGEGIAGLAGKFRPMGGRVTTTRRGAFGGR